MSVDDTDLAGDPEQFWEERYRSATQVWSGHVNEQLASVASDLAPGRALDLGCGEGADAIWLAERGWTVTATDISRTALERGREQATRRGVGPHIRWLRLDLSAAFPDGTFDLVSAQYLHSPVELRREDILRRAARAVDPGGTLLVVGHAEPPPWAEGHHAPRFPTPAEVVDACGLAEPAWQVDRAETVRREATGPGGTRGTLVDSVVVGIRRAR